MNFCEALYLLNQGFLLKRKCWVGVVYVKNEKIIHRVDYNEQEWTPTNDDILANDWLVIDRH